MTKIIKIDTCSACPYKLMTPDFKRKCRIFGYKIIDVPITTIPYWCPLEDAVLTSAIHSDGKKQCNCVSGRSQSTGGCPIHGCTF